ncbi:hypothetical protein [Bacillus xiapuensis]|uniref:Uncharacterized protein n=1 Tax=Bacillus xiapuensis TaxID=2014075 RepID=A0ABU6N849_9BACI|nr:hypothetical protein [Bacillus xiapuensis]
MINEEYQEVEVKKIEKKVVSKKIICNKCGGFHELKENGNWYESDVELFANDIHNISLGFGYGSKFDTEHWNFDLCDNCLEDVIKTFKYVPDGFKEDRGYYIIKDQEEHQKIFEHWQQTGEWEELNFKSYEELLEFSDLFKKEYINEIIKKNYPNKPLLNDLD